MAYGLSDVAGVFALPPEPALGYYEWAELSGMDAGHPLVGGYSGEPGYGRLSGRVALGMADPTTAAAAGAPPAAHWSQLFNFRGNPIGWVLIFMLLYYALNFVHFHGSVAAATRIGR